MQFSSKDIQLFNECIEIVDSLTKNISQILSVHSIENLNNDEEYLKINDTLEDILKKYEILANQKKITVNDFNTFININISFFIFSNIVFHVFQYYFKTSKRSFKFMGCAFKKVIF